MTMTVNSVNEETMQEYDAWVEHHERTDEGVIEAASRKSANSVMQAFYVDMFKVVGSCMKCGEKIFPSFNDKDVIETDDDGVSIRSFVECSECEHETVINIRKHGENVFDYMLKAMRGSSGSFVDDSDLF